MKYQDPCKPLYKERGNVVHGSLDDNMKRINKEGGGEKEQGGSKGDDDGDNNDAEEGEEKEGDASLEDASNNKEIYSAVASGQNTTTTNTKDDAKDKDDKEGRMVGIPQLKVCAMGHMEAVAKSITERDIECIKHLNDNTF